MRVEPASRPPHVVVVGGGAGGLVLATRLGERYGRRDRLRVTLVDAQLTHIWKPLLHEVAAGSMNPYEDELNYFAQARRHDFSFQPGRMVDLDRARRVIRLDEMQDEAGEAVLETREIPYDHLVIAVGSTANDFGTPGAREHCIFLDTRGQAERFHRALLNAYYRAKARGEQDARLDVAIVGAGATGVELAAEVHHAAQGLVRYGLDGIRPADVRITLIEAAERILPQLGERVSRLAAAALESIGVAVLLGERVMRVDRDAIVTAAGRRIAAQLKVWSAGIQAPEFLRDLDGLENGRGNTLVVDDRLLTSRDPRVSAIGDCAWCTLRDRKGRTFVVPPRAQSAFQQAFWLARALPERLDGRDVKPFVYRDRGSLVSLSTESTVGQLMGNLMGNVDVEGRIARLMYISLYRRHQSALHGVPRTIVFMLKDALARGAGPRLKLH